MAVTAKTARGAARKPGGASRRHAQAVPDFQARNANMRLTESELSVLLRAIQAAGREPLDDSAHYARFDFQPYAGLQRPGGMFGRFNAAA